MWLTALLGLVDPISRISKAIADTKIARANAETDQDKIAADERIKTLEMRRDVMVEEAKNSKANGIVRAFLATPIGILLWKIFVYDKALGQWTGGRTDGLSPELWQVVTVVLGFYFLYEAVTYNRRK